jgi:hypothetical protein
MQQHPITHDYSSGLRSYLYQTDTIQSIGSAYSLALRTKNHRAETHPPRPKR